MKGVEDEREGGEMRGKGDNDGRWRDTMTTLAPCLQAPFCWVVRGGGDNDMVERTNNNGEGMAHTVTFFSSFYFFSAL